MIDENADRARVATEQAYTKQKASKIQKVNKYILTKVLVAVALIVAIWLAMGFDLIAPPLAIPLIAGVMIWVSGHLGAWLQYTGRGPLR
jgi:hypothetical protein